MNDLNSGMDEEELKTIVSAEINNSIGYLNGELEGARIESIDRYFGRPLGNELEGRSKVISTDVFDVVEGVLPHIMKLFVSGDQVVRFQPMGPEDEEAADQATDVINHIFMRQNNGYLTIHNAIKDALIQKNGFIKVWVEQEEQWKREQYNGIDEQTLPLILNDPEIEVISSEPYYHETIDPESGQPIVAVCYNVIAKRAENKRRYRVESVPPEEVIVSREARNLEDARMIGHRRRMTISDLREMGIEEEILDRLGSGENDIDLTNASLARNTVEEEIVGGELSIMNKEMALIWVTECYIRVDYDGDGIAEMRKIVVAGPGHELLSNDPWDSEQPFSTGSPIINPHRWVGLSLTDLSHEVQEVKTVLFRQMLDSLYHSNNPKYEVFEQGIIDPEELTTDRPGGIVRVTTQNAIRPLQTANTAQYALQGLEYLDQIKENRTGFNRYAQGTDANALNKTATGVNALQNAAMERILLFSRNLGETLIAPAFRKLYRLFVQYEDKDMVFRLRNQWVPIDPRTWNAEMDVSVEVGLGTGNRDQMVGQLNLLLDRQLNLLQIQGGPDGPLVKMENLYNTLEKLVQAMGLKTVEPYFANPASAEPQQPQQPDPAQIEMEQKAKESEQKHMVDMGKLQLEAQKLQLQAASLGLTQPQINGVQ